MNRLLYHIACLVVVSVGAVAQERYSAGAQNPDIKILESTERGITFEFTPRYLASEKILAQGIEYQLVRFERSSGWAQGSEGKPDVRFRSLAVGFPGRSNNRISIIGSDYETVTGYSLSPVPTITPETEKNPTIRRYEPSSPVTDDFYPSTVAEMPEVVAVTKGVPVGYIKLFPVQYNSASKVLRRYSRIVVRVDFGAPQHLTASANDDDWMRASLLNYQVEKGFLRAAGTLGKRAAVNSVLSSGNWFKLEVREDGMYKIDAAYLRAIGIDRASIGSIRDLKVYGNSARILPEDLLQPRPADLTQQAALYYDANGNSKFDEEDYILFYGQGVTGWTYSPNAREYSHYTNPYSNTNYYFLQYLPQSAPGKQMSPASPPAAGVRIATTVGKLFFHEERTNVNHSGLEWFSAPMLANESRVIVNKLEGYIAGSPVLYKYEMLSRSDVNTLFDIQESGNTIASLFLFGFTTAALESPEGNYADREQGRVSAVPQLTDSRSTLKLIYTANSSIAKGFINWVEILYPQQLTAVGDALLFTSPDSSGSVEYALAGFSPNNFSVFDVTDVFNVRTVAADAGQAAGSWLFRDNLTTGNVKRYWAGTSAAYKTPVSFARIPNTNVRGGVPGADYVIITHRDFAAEVQRLKTHKENLPGGEALKTYVVEVDTLYNEFGGGMPDPVAIRDFLEYASLNWQPAPRYVLFFGDACFDYKNILGIDRNWVPTYETPESNNQIYSYGYDDFYAYLQPGNTFKVSTANGRLPVRSAAQARFVVDRIIKYESAPVYGPWRNLITITADDHNVNGAYESTENPEQAETLAEQFVPKSFEVKKIYENEYPTVFTSTGRRKPEARQAILDQINRGTLVLNFTGHGNPTVWSHESILTRDDVITQLFNGDKLTFIVGATCDWGRFDDAGDQSSAEEALVNQNGGAIGVISADRAVWSGDNAVTNQTIYFRTFPQDPYSRTLRLGDGLMLGKNDASQSLENNRKYHLFGDPTMRLAVPQLVMQLDSINGDPVSATSFDTLRALSKVTIKASVRNSSGVVQNISSDSALVAVFDAARLETVSDNDVNIPYSISFLKPGAIIYKGENSIRNGLLSATFIVPKDISYENKQGRISVYFSGSGTDGRGFTDRVVVGGTAQNFMVDTQGPSINIFLDSRSFRSGDLVSENPLLIVDLADSSGINSAGSSVGHRLEAWLDGGAKSSDLTDFYKGARDNYQAGSIEYPLSAIPAGQHSLRVRAWDVYNNSSTTEVQFSVATSTTLSLQNVYNIPNPARSSTSFTFQHNQLSPLDVEIKIYTVSGRLIQTISSPGYPDRFVQIPWDCRDRDGAKIANGTYLYKVLARTVDGRFTSEALGKMSVVR